MAAATDTARFDPAVRQDGYAPIRDYAAIGDGHTVALIARDGCIDWLCLPTLDSPSIFAAVVDARRGGRFALEPETPYTTERHYLPGTNVLETTFRTADGTVRITDGLTLDEQPAPYRELVRRIEGLAGRVALRWIVEARFDYGRARPEVDGRSGIPMASWEDNTIAVLPFDAGDPRCTEGTIEGRLECREGERACLVLAAAHDGQLVIPDRTDPEARLDRTAGHWERWSAERQVRGPLAGRRAAKRTRAQAPRLRPFGRDRSRTHHVAARGDRPRTQLGLPLRLGARRGVHAQRLARAGLRSGGAWFAFVAPGCVGAELSGAERALPPRRRILPAGGRAAARGLPRLASGTSGQSTRPAR